MKQTLAFIMAIAVLGSTLSMTAFAAIQYPVAGVSSRGYVLEDDSTALDLDNPVDKVNYGKTVYFPLLSAASSTVSQKQKEYDDAKKKYDDAYKLYEDNYKPKLNTYNAKKTAADAATEALNKFDYVKELAAADVKINAAKQAVTDAETEQRRLEDVYKESVTKFEVQDSAWKGAGSPTTGPLKTNRDAAEKKMNDDKKAFEDQRDIIVPQKKKAVTTAENEKVALGSKNTELENTKKAKDSELATAEKALTDATNKLTIALALQAVTDAETDMGNKKTAMKNAEDALKAAGEANKYKYVYESDATKNTSISKKWEEGGSYVGKVEVTKIRASQDPPGTTSSSMRYIYCLAITIDKSSSTQSRDLFGTVTLKKSGSDGFNISTSIAVELGYSYASDTDAGDGVITSTPTTFKEGKGFDADREFEFEFKSDSKSRFVVDTVGQGSIVLSFDTDPDDKLLKKYPKADLWFFNGNYASFNRVGTLYLGGFDDDDYYVYEVSKSGQLTRVSAKYDSYEEAYKISTRTLGRYVVSDTKLQVTTSSSSSSSSSGGTGTGSGTGTGTGGTGTTVVPTTPSPSYPYTPPVASSSTPPPAQSSKPESSESEPEESSSEPEELEDEDDIVDVIVDDDEVEGPEEKSGIPAWVWALIITGLAAVPVGIGVVYYLHNRPLRREFFSRDEEDGFEDDYDDDED